MNSNIKERTCKKCGEPLASTNKHKYCENCRREKAQKRRHIGETVFGVGLLVCACIPGVNKFIKKD